MKENPRLEATPTVSGNRRCCCCSFNDNAHQQLEDRNEPVNRTIYMSLMKGPLMRSELRLADQKALKRPKKPLGLSPIHLGVNGTIFGCTKEVTTMAVTAFDDRPWRDAWTIASPR